MTHAKRHLPEKLLVDIYMLMLRSRLLEDQQIKLYRAGEAFFWTGGPGEEAWGVPLGLLLQRSKDWFFPHYRSSSALVAMGVRSIDTLRMLLMRSTDPFTGGRNFSNHFAIPEWKVAPVTSPIANQYVFALGTAHAQKRSKDGSLTVVCGGDAGTAQCDFENCLVVSSRPGHELPILITVQNNFWGISTPFEGQHGESEIADRPRSFGIRSRVIDGLDPVESYVAIQEEMTYIRTTGRPAFIEAHVSRLYGHSSASGANRDHTQRDPLEEFERKLLHSEVLDKKMILSIRESIAFELAIAEDQARPEPVPTHASVWNHVYKNSENADWRKF